jgi:hypothetical protein
VWDKVDQKASKMVNGEGGRRPVLGFAGTAIVHPFNSALSREIIALHWQSSLSHAARDSSPWRALRANSG